MEGAPAETKQDHDEHERPEPLVEHEERVLDRRRDLLHHHQADRYHHEHENDGNPVEEPGNQPITHGMTSRIRLAAAPTIAESGRARTGVLHR